MKKLTIVGIGMNAQTITKEGLQAIENAEVILGAKRMLDIVAPINQTSHATYLPNDVAQIVKTSKAVTFAVLVSGDTGFYSAAEKLTETLLDCEITFIPGISSLHYFFAKQKQPWQNAAIVSCHGRSANLVDTVRRNKQTFALTGGNINQLAHDLCNAGFTNLTVTIGENLGMEDERIFSCTPKELQSICLKILAVLLIENPLSENRIAFGIPDEHFIRSEVPMTKAEVRAITMSKLNIQPTSHCCDIGAGTGAVTVEMALAAYDGHVYAIDHNERAFALIQENAKAFHLGNVTAIHATAPEALHGFPHLDAAFIGGSSGNIKEIMDVLLEKNPCTRIVINAIALETVQVAIAAFAKHNIEAEIIQVSIAKAKQAGKLHMLLANNPVFVISGGGFHV